MNKRLILLAALTCILSACKDDDEADTPQNTNGNLQLNLTGLEDVGANQRYEGWLIVNNIPISTGTFSVNQSGTPSNFLGIT